MPEVESGMGWGAVGRRAWLPVSWCLAGAAAAVTAADGTTGWEAPLVLWPLDHGFAGVPAPVHLGLNVTLLFLLGARLERALTSLQVVTLTAGAYLAYLIGLLVAGALWDLDAVGLSGILWAWLFPTRLALPPGRPRSSFEPLFWLMLVWIPVGFAVVTALLNTERWLAAALLANLFHGIGTVVGLLAAVLLPTVLHRRGATRQEGGPGDLPGPAR